MSKLTPEYLREMLRKTGMKQTDLAAAMGMTDDKLSKFMRGHRRLQHDEVQKAVNFFAQSVEPTPGFSEPSPQPRIDMNLILDGKDIPAQVKNTENDELNKVMLALVGDRVQVAGTYDRAGIDKLISRLQAVKDLLD